MDSIDHTFSNNPMDVSSLPKYEEAPLRRLEPNFLIKRNIGTSITLIIFLGLLLGAYLLGPPDYTSYYPLVAGGVIIFAVWGFIQNYQLYKRNAFGLREKDIIYKRGFLIERTTVVPFNRVQHVSTHRSMLDKSLGLATLKIFTAGGSGSDVAIPGLNPETADSLKQNLAERMGGDE